MRSLVIFSAVVVTLVTACNNNADTAQKKTATSDSANSQVASTAANNVQGQASVNDVVAAYMQLKNALANDNGKDAASAANTLSEALKKTEVNALPAGQKAMYADVSDDMKEHAEHIATNAGKVEHQREHFESLSKDLYDLVKAGSVKQTLYKDFCPMYNNNKGGMWLSETKEIKNPYLGQKMPTCGEVQEEIVKK
jgi:hypothetical protein